MITNSNELELNDPIGYRCVPMDQAVDVAKWAYYTSRTLRFLESKIPVP